MPKTAAYRRKKRKLKKFRMSEIAAVDRPAQEPSTVAIMKRAGEEFTKSPDETPYVLTSSDDDHAHGIWLYGSGGSTSENTGAGEDMEHSHPWIWENGTIVVGEAQGHIHTVDQTAIMNAIMVLAKRGDSPEDLQALVEVGLALAEGEMPIVTKNDLRHAVEAFGEFAGDKDIAAQHILRRASELAANDMLPTEGALALEETTMPDPITPDTAAIESENADLKAQVARLQAVGEMTDVQKAHFTSLDESGQADFIAKSASEREAVVTEITKRSEDSNPIVFTSADGTEFRKNDDPRLVAMAKRDDEREKELIKLRSDRTNDEFVKRAETELGHLPGTPVEKAALLRSIDGIEDETVRKAAHAAVVAGDKAMVAAFESTGSSTVPVATSAEAELDAKAKELAKADNIDFYTAYDRVSRENPELTKRAVNKE